MKKRGEERRGGRREEESKGLSIRGRELCELDFLNNPANDNPERDGLGLMFEKRMGWNALFSLRDRSSIKKNKSSLQINLGENCCRWEAWLNGSLRAGAGDKDEDEEDEDESEDQWGLNRFSLRDHSQDRGAMLLQQMKWLQVRRCVHEAP